MLDRVCPPSHGRLPAAARVLTLSLLALCAVLAPRPAAAAGPTTVPVGHIDGVIGAGTARYVERVIRDAERSGAPAVVLTVNAGAGYERATRQTVDRIEQASIPVLVFVYPNGGRAVDAGLFVLQAADVAAMAPGTSAGASGGRQGPAAASAGPAPPAVATAAAFVAGLAQTRGRNARWVQGAVQDGATAPASEALRQGIVDDVASDVPDLLSKADGRRVTGPWGTSPLATRALATEAVQPSWLERVIDLLVDPNVAFLLLVLGLYGVVTELAAPGVTVPGVAGAIALILALYGFANLPVNWAGVALIAVAAGLFLAESQVASHGLFTVAGLAAFVSGAAILFRSPDGTPSPYGATGALNPWLVVVLGLGSALCCAWLVRQSLESVRRPHANVPPVDGEEGLAGPMVDAVGTVYLGGQSWSAEWAPGTVAPGQRVRVVGRRGLRLIVEPLDDPP